MYATDKWSFPTITLSSNTPATASTAFTPTTYYTNTKNVNTIGAFRGDFTIGADSNNGIFYVKFGHLGPMLLTTLCNSA